ncbi:MAG TPA: twin-arginine translocase subunit TatC [bacterium]|jgi:sec-independent protein translocase protein TatC
MADTDGPSMTFWDHLDELRKRLLRSLAAIVVASIIGFLLSGPAQTFLMRPFLDKVQGSLALLAPADGFMVQMKISIIIGIAIALPFVAFELYGFIGPGLKPKEKRWIWPVVIIANLLFWVGIAFAWYCLPVALEFFGSYGGEGVQNLWSLKNYINLLLFLLLAFGIIFQLPLIIGILIATGLVPSKFFREHRRFAIIANFVIAAVATPTTDMVTMLAMAIPLCILYEMSIWVGIIIESRRKAKLPAAQ